MKKPKAKRGTVIKWLLGHVGHHGDDCLTWPFGRDDKGYGMVAYKGRIWKASRLMCFLTHGEPPTPTHQAAHSCGRGRFGCVNPDHLSWKTPVGNTQDAIKHGRYGFNSAGQTGKLKARAVSEIKALAGRLTNLELGMIYGVHAETIAKIRRGETWRKVA